MHVTSIFDEISIIIAACTVAGFIGIKARQPLITAFIVVGVLLGPTGFGMVKSGDQIDLFAKIGISLLLFIVGLKLDIHVLKSTGLIALATGIGQVLFTSIIGYVFCLLFGMNAMTSLYVSLALTFSSTIIIIKLLSDKGDVDSAYGRVAIGLLIVQDILVIIALIGINALATHSGETNTFKFGITIAFRGCLMLLVIAILMRFVIPHVIAWIEKHEELTMLSVISWAIGLAAIAEYVGFSKEIGAFLAGFSLTVSPLRDRISDRLTVLRDFMLVFFFIDLGSKLKLDLLGDNLFASLGLSAFVLIGNPIIVMFIMTWMRYSTYDSFRCGLTVAQISEFSLLLGALGVAVGHIDRGAMAVITMVGIVTIALSTYMIIYSEKLYNWMKPYLRVFDKISTRE